MTVKTNGVVACACWLAGLALAPAAAQADTAPRYTYLGAGYEWNDTRCAVRVEKEKVDGYDVQASLGIIRYVHAYADYFGGVSDTSLGKLQCYKAGLGASYPITHNIDVVGRAGYVHAKLSDLKSDGYEVEGGVRIMASEKAEVHVSYALTDLTDVSTRDVRLGLVYNITPMFAIRGGGVVFDRYTGIELGLRVYLGKTLF
jgi:hypothetical protein